ncbi:MAG TPA: KH domain-containing protein [Candidatus Ligilactobacillus excrementigallinarum]|uniref:RNA-binding protein KhpA n=1 Tax=Candidatus Ligilactobacillus excrementigallinarum TaxID=2838641 RepID=A0A9D2AAS8_9LACO|nr:KH domain-containing protein [Candidatus Ligilactobacillus excrementigallinarum]
MTKETVKQLLLTIVKALVTIPDEVTIDFIEDERFINYNVSVASVDVGRVIGKNGTVIQAIRSLVYGIRVDDTLRIKLNIVD